MDLTEIHLRELSNKTKRYFMVSVVKQLIDRYILNFDSLAEHMYRAYGICIVLEDYLDYNDLIDGVYQIYEKTGIMMQN